LRDAITSIVAPSLQLAAIGAALGLVLTWFASALIRNLIWGVQPHDVRTYIIVSALMFLIAALASVLPALRLIKLDPAQTLREE
jgi:ABC-type antimicrobial peptide transport system permease subunit